MNQTAATLANLNGHSHLLELLREHGAELEEEIPSASVDCNEQKVKILLE